MNRKSYLAILLYTLVIACDPSALYKNDVNNRSIHQIWVATLISNSVYDSIVIQPRTKVSISGAGGLGNTVSNCLFKPSNVSFKVGVVGNSGLTVTKDFNLESNWSLKKKKSGIDGSGSCTFTITIEEKDIQ